MKSKSLLSYFVFFVLFCSLIINPVFSSSIMWSHTFGGEYGEAARDIIQTSEGGYAIVGFKPTEENGNNDYWLIKTDENGNEEWNQTYGGIHDDHAFSIIETQDQGFIITGEWLVVKIDKQGNMLWNETFLEGIIRSLVTIFIRSSVKLDLSLEKTLQFS